MALAQGTGQFVARGVYLYTWNLTVGTASVGSWAQLPHLPDRTVEVLSTGTFAATVIIQGTNQGAIPAGGGTASTLSSGAKSFTLNDSRGVGNALSFTTGKVATILENVFNIRPRITVSGAGGSAKYTVRIVAESRLR